MYKIEKGGPFYSTLNSLKFLGQIPASNEKYYMIKFYIGFSLTKCLSFFFTTIGPILHLIVSLMGHTGTDISEDISITLGATGGAVLSLLFTLKYHEWSNLFKNMVDTTEYGKPATFEETVHRLNRHGKICFICVPSVAIIYGLGAWFNAKGCKTQAEFYQICPVFVPIWLPFGANDRVIGLTVFLLQTTFVGLIAQTFLPECFIMYEATEMLISHISHLKDYFRVAFDVKSEVEVRERLRLCIDYHKHILDLGNELSSLIKYTSGHMSILSAIVCGCVGNQMLNTKPLSSFIFLAAWLFSLYCFCHAGQRIKDKTLSIADAIWDSKWYNTDARTQKDVQFILLRCQRPICYVALPLGVLDYPFYYMMMKTGYTYFALFNKSL